jgi:hypothetical protein
MLTSDPRSKSSRARRGRDLVVALSLAAGLAGCRAPSVGTEVLTLACAGSHVVVGGRNRKVFVSHDGGRSSTEDPFAPLLTDPVLVSAQASAVTERGTMFVGLEGHYRNGTGSLFRWDPP